MPSQMCLKTWLQQHDAPPHGSEAVTEFLNLTFSQQWIRFMWPNEMATLGHQISEMLLIWSHYCDMTLCPDAQFPLASSMLLLLLLLLLLVCWAMQPFSLSRSRTTDSVRNTMETAAHSILCGDFSNSKCHTCLPRLIFFYPKTMQTCGVKCA